MKRLLAYLFIILGFGLGHNINNNALAKKSDRNIEYCFYPEFSSIEINKKKFFKKSNCNLINKVDNPILYSKVFSQIKPYPRNCTNANLCKFRSTYYIASKYLKNVLITYGITSETDTQLAVNEVIIINTKGKQLDLVFCKYNNALESNQQREFSQTVYINFKEEGCNKYITSTGYEGKFSKKKNLEIAYEVFIKKRKKFYGICYSERLNKITYKKMAASD